jgi:hypothetical protein
MKWVQASLVERSDGSATISGLLGDWSCLWRVSISLSGRQLTSQGLNPLVQNQGSCGGFNDDAWYFYRSLSGKLQNMASGEEFEISMNPKHPAQVGNYANLKNGNFGISFWMFIRDCDGRVVDADLNSDIVC